MSDPRDPLAALPAEDPRDAAARETRHQVLAGLLGAHADGELPAETTAQLEAHLVGCARCRRELAVQAAVRGRLAAEPSAGAAPALRARVAAAVAALPAPAEASGHGAGRVHRRVAAAIATVATLALAAAAIVTEPWTRPDDGDGTAVAGRLVATPVGSDALLGNVVADFRRVAAHDLPGRARDLDAVRGAVPFPVEPLRASGLRLLAAWTTDLGGEPAAVLAYRWNDRLVVQYLVDEARFFRSPAMRAGVAAGHALSAVEDGVSVVAWPTADAGTLLAAELPAARLASLWTAARLAERGARGAQ